MCPTWEECEAYVQCNSVVLSYSHPAESQSISCEEMSFLQLSSCGHFMSDHSDAKLQRPASRWSRCKLTSNFSWVEVNSEKCRMLQLVCSLQPCYQCYTMAFCLTYILKRPQNGEQWKISAPDTTHLQWNKFRICCKE